MGVSQNGWFKRENPTKRDDLGVLQENPKCFAQILFGIFATPFKERSLNLATCAGWGV